MLFVDFPWYDAPFLKSTHDRLWSELRSRLQGRVVDLPERRHSHIRHDDLLLSDQLLLTQTCGFYLATNTPKFLNIVGTPVFDLPECPPGFYFSYFVSGKTSLDGELRIAANDFRSWSGCHTLLEFCEREHLKADSSRSVVTGGHHASTYPAAPGFTRWSPTSRGGRPPSQPSAHSAAQVCTVNRTAGRNEWRSSRNPTKPTIPPPPTRAMVSSLDTSSITASAITPTVTAMTTASPPPRGVVRVCELRGFGTSTRPRADAKPRTTPVSRIETANTRAPSSVTCNFTVRGELCGSPAAGTARLER